MLSRRLLRIKAVKALYSHFKSESDSLIVSEKNLMLSIDKTYELYHQMLWLVVEVANYAENRIELGRRKHLPTPEELNPNTKFVDNRVVAALRESDALTDYLQRKKLGWVQAPELVKKLYHAMVESDYYRKYMDAPARSFKEDVRLVESFYTRTVGESEALEEALCFGWIEIFGDMDRNATRIEMVDKIGDAASFASPFPSFEEHDHSRARLLGFLLKHHQAVDERIVVGLVFFFGKLWLVGYDRLEHCHW